MEDETERLDVEVILAGVSCLHRRMEECHPGCGHWHCPDCGLSWDDDGEG